MKQDKKDILKEKLPSYSIGNFTRIDSSDFYCNRLSDHLKNHHFIFEPHKHEFYIAVLFTKGKGTHMIDFREYKVKAGSLFFLQPGQVHNWWFSEKTEGIILFHSKQFFDTYSRIRLYDLPFYNSEFSYPCLNLTGTSLITIKDLFRQILDEQSRSTSPFSRSIILALLNLLYLQCSRIYLKGSSHNKEAEHSSKVDDYLQLVNTSFTKHHDVSYYADKLNITPRHLNRVINHALNKKASEIIIQRILLEAQRLLVLTDHNINEIADLLGFSDASYFVRFFKKHDGRTPLAFRTEEKRSF